MTARKPRATSVKNASTKERMLDGMCAVSIVAVLLVAFSPAQAQPEASDTQATPPITTDEIVPASNTEEQPPADTAVAEPKPRPAFAVWLEQLDHPAWAVREEATEALMVDATHNLRELLNAANALSPSLERQERIEHIIRQRLLAQIVAEIAQPGDAASLGITHPGQRLDALPNHEGVEIVVMDTLPGFPAYTVLRPGDVIVSLNGQPIPQGAKPEDPPPIKPMLEALKAGDTVPIGIYRDGRPMNLTVTLASSRSLNQVYTASPTALRPVYAQRLTQRRLKLIGTINTMPPDATDAATTPPAQPDSPAAAGSTDSPDPPEASGQPSPTGQPAPTEPQPAH